VVTTGVDGLLGGIGLVVGRFRRLKVEDLIRSVGRREVVNLALGSLDLVPFFHHEGGIIV
jgi:hypothetical protein